MEIAVAGAGVAGLAVASLLRRQGRNVVVYDMAPSPAPVGSGLILQPVGQDVLKQLRLLDEVANAGARLERLHAENVAGRTVLNVRYDALGSGVAGVGVHRASLFDVLHRNAVEAGVEFERGNKVQNVTGDARGRLQLSFEDGVSSPSFDLIIDAAGVRSPLVRRENALLDFGALWANVPWPDIPAFHPRRLTQKYASADCSAGVMPIGRGGGDNPQAAFFWTLRRKDYQT